MPSPTKGPRFGGSPAHQRLIMGNLAQSLFEHGRITTTEAKARRLRPYAESLISKAKVDCVANRRHVVKSIRDKDVLHTLFTEIGPAMATRPGGYTRILKVNPRKGDNAPMAVIEIVETEEFDAQGMVASEAPTDTPAAPPESVDSEGDEAPASTAGAASVVTGVVPGVPASNAAAEPAADDADADADDVDAADEDNAVEDNANADADEPK